MSTNSRAYVATVISVSVGLAPLCFALPGALKNLPLALVFVTGIALWARRPDIRHRAREACPVLIAASIVMLFALASILLHRQGWRDADLPSHVLLFLGAAAVFAWPGLRWRTVEAGLAAGAGVLGAVSLYQRFVLALPRSHGLNGGPWAAIEFAMVTLMLAVLALLPALDAHRSRAVRILHALAAAVGVAGAVLTQSRGPLLALLPVLGLLIWLHARRQRRWRSVALVVLGLLAVAVVAAATLHERMFHRLEAIRSEVVRADAHHGRGAIRERLEMWRLAVAAFADHPLAGVGPNRFGTYARAQIAAGRASPAVAHYDHPHNEYLEAAATGGVPGLLVLLGVFAVPAAYFFRRSRSPDPDVAEAACAGLLVVAMYALCALTDNVFYRAMPHSLYFFLVCGLAMRATRRPEPSLSVPAWRASA